MRDCNAATRRPHHGPSDPGLQFRQSQFTPVAGAAPAAVNSRAWVSRAWASRAWANTLGCGSLWTASAALRACCAHVGHVGADSACEAEGVPFQPIHRGDRCGRCRCCGCCCGWWWWWWCGCTCGRGEPLCRSSWRLCRWSLAPCGTIRRTICRRNVIASASKRSSACPCHARKYSQIRVKVPPQLSGNPSISTFWEPKIVGCTHKS